MHRYAAICIIFCAVIATAGCLNDDDDSRDSTVTTMTMQAYLDQYRQRKNTANKTAYIWLTSLNAGDTVIINDTIDTITYNTSSQKNRTLITFSTVNSTSPLRGGLAFQGNITDRFHPGDTITVTAHIANVTFYQTQPSIGATWTVHYELFREQWDNVTNASVPLPQRCIEHTTDH